MSEQPTTTSPPPRRSADERRHARGAPRRARRSTSRSAPGVFSPGGLDKGTARAPRRGARPAAHRRPSSTSAAAGDRSRSPSPCAPPRPPSGRVDVNERALDLARAQRRRARPRRRARGHGRRRPGRRAVRPIWSNPPIRVGKAALHDLLGTWLPRLARTAWPTSWCRGTSGRTPCSAGSSRARDAVPAARHEQGLPGAARCGRVTTTIPALGVVLVPTLPPEALRPLAPGRRPPPRRAVALGGLLQGELDRRRGRGPGLDRAVGSASAWRRSPCATSRCSPWSSPPCTGSSRAAAARHRARRAGLDGAGRGTPGVAPDPAARARRGAAPLLDGEEVTASGRYVTSTGCADGLRCPAPRCSSAARPTHPRARRRVGDGILLGSSCPWPTSPSRWPRRASAGRWTPRCRSSPTCWSPSATPALGRGCAPRRSPRSGVPPGVSAGVRTVPDLRVSCQIVGRDVRARRAADVGQAERSRARSTVPSATSTAGPGQLDAVVGQQPHGEPARRARRPARRPRCPGRRPRSSWRWPPRTPRCRTSGSPRRRARARASRRGPGRIGRDQLDVGAVRRARVRTRGATVRSSSSRSSARASATTVCGLPRSTRRAEQGRRRRRGAPGRRSRRAARSPAPASRQRPEVDREPVAVAAHLLDAGPAGDRRTRRRPVVEALAHAGRPRRPGCRCRTSRPGCRRRCGSP